MSLFHALILSIVEGFTEFLPISSTAHLILTSHILGLDQSVFVKTFEIVIQSGAILALVVMYWKKFFDLELLKKIAAAFIPTGIIGLVLYKVAKQYLIGNITVVLSALLIGGVLLILFEKMFADQAEGEGSDIRTLSYGRAALIGVAQAIAIIPGVSRSAATIIAGRLAGMTKEAIVEFSFLLAVPTILAATGLDLLKNLSVFKTAEVAPLAVGFIGSFVFALLGITFLLSYIKRHSFSVFGVYRILLVIIFVAFFW